MYVGGGGGFWTVELATGTHDAFLQTEAFEAMPAFSPDGRFVAYVSDHSGRQEVYVREFPGPGTESVVSRSGGTKPAWARSGEIFFRNGDKMMSVEVQTEPELRLDRPELLFEGEFHTNPNAVRFYDVTPDGQRLLMVRELSTSEITELRVIAGFAPSDRR